MSDPANTDSTVDCGKRTPGPQTLSADELLKQSAFGPRTRRGPDKAAVQGKIRPKTTSSSVGAHSVRVQAVEEDQRAAKPTVSRVKGPDPAGQKTETSQYIIDNYLLDAPEEDEEDMEEIQTMERVEETQITDLPTRVKTQPGAFPSSGELEPNAEVSAELDVLPGSDCEEYLAVADPVDESDTCSFQETLPQAEEVDEENQQARKKARRSREAKKQSLTGCVGVALVTALVATVLVIVLFLPGDSVPAQDQAPTVPHFISTSAESLALDLLTPNISSLQDIKKEDSPQAKAWEWLMRDPFLDAYPPYRIQQRYILATFYYSTGGPEWVNDTNWLNYGTHECSWKATAHYLPPEYEATMIQSGNNMFLSQTGRDITDGPCGNALEDPRETSDTFKYFFLPLNGLVGTIPLEIFKLTSLRGINLSLNPKLEGNPLPTEVGLLTDLQVVAFLHNPILQGTMPTELSKLTDLTDLVISGTPLSGTIPSQIGLLADNLSTFIWGVEQFPGITSGTIPTELGWATTLEALRFIGDFTGGVPSQLGSLQKLSYLDLTGNNLSSVIPSQLGLLHKLETGLYLPNNKFSGSIPTELGELKLVRRVDLEGNQLTGRIPSELGLLTAATHLNFRSNTLSGRVPVALCASLGEFNKGKNPNFYTGLSFDCDSDLCGCQWCNCSDYAAR